MRLRSLALLLLSSACVAPTTGQLRFGAEEEQVELSGLSACSEAAEGREVLVDPARPLVILVHGCNSSAGKFRTLAKVFETHGQQTLCFNYDDRDWINNAGVRLVGILEALQERMEPQTVTVIGHSQGGLVARRALSAGYERTVEVTPGFDFRLVTVSTPFGGIASSSDCGRLWLHFLSLSATVGICQVVAGNKWTEIYPWSRFMTAPGAMIGAARGHLQIVTDERDQCREVGEDGECRRDDFVFSVKEQTQPAIEGDPRVRVVTLRAGHSRVVGEGGEPPTLLIEALQQGQVLAKTPPARAAEVNALLARLYSPR